MSRIFHRFLAAAGGAGLIGGMLFWAGSGCRSLTPAQPVPPKTAKLSFNEVIQPILSENCYQCHGPDRSARKGDLRLDRAEFAFAPREKGGPAIVKGDAAHSPLIKRIESLDERERMPPLEAHKHLKPADIALLRRWVSEGAEYQEHWAFIAPVRPPVPQSSTHPDWAKTPIDHFILARLEREGLAPGPEADRRSLIRRVTLDLTGLPPTPEAVVAFLADREPGAYERVVDRLLASSAYGEHRARYWLDYVRYADTNGIFFDNYRAIWPYRDYVIRAFNQNKPLDRFVREQLAGDLLPEATLDDWVATGLMRCNLTTNEGGTVPEEVWVNQTRDRVEAFGGTFLGLTTGCAACHDHKFDPISQRDHYGLAAFLGNTLEKPWDGYDSEPAPVLRIPTANNRASVDALVAKRGELQKRLDAIRATGAQRLRDWLAAGHRPLPVASDRLELRLRLDEGHGGTVTNSAPGARPATYAVVTNPLIWGENSWLWPSMRMDIFTRLPLGQIGDVDSGDKFSAGGWIMLRGKPGLNGKGTGNGSLFARMGDAQRLDGRGWEIYQENLHLSVNLMQRTGQTGIEVTTKKPVERDEWMHVFYTYDGSRTAAGVRFYIDGKRVETEAKLDNLGTGSIRTSATTHLGRRDDFEPMRETRFQDVRFYRRTLTDEEVARLPFEDPAAEIVARQPDPAKWTTDESFVALDRYFLGEADPEARALVAAIARHDAAIAALSQDGIPTLVAREKPSPAYSAVLKRGDYFARVERIAPATPHFLPPMAAGQPRNRLGLANWLLTPEQPLFGRVTVNRMWQEVFGRGLVESSGDFGVMGTRPSHPELLDWMAVDLRENGWDLKRLYRMMVTSAVYRQSAAVTPLSAAKDPANRLLSRGPRFRLDAEVLRDTALAVAGLLVNRLGGPPAKPYQPPGLWEEVAMIESTTRHYEQDHGDGLYRRSLYTFWKRTSPPPSLEAFDSTSRETICVRRARTNTPLQALVTMNDPQWIEAARKLAERALRASPDDAGLLDCLAQLTLSRPLSGSERQRCGEALAKYRPYFAAHPSEVGALLAVGESPVDPSLDPASVADWTMVSSTFLNLDEFLTN